MNKVRIKVKIGIKDIKIDVLSGFLKVNLVKDER